MNPEYSRFSEFRYDIDQETPFGLRIKVDAESSKTEEGTICVLPHMNGPPMHKHSEQEETFTVLEGELFAQVGNDKLTLRAGESVTFPKHTPHTYANRSDKVCVFRYKLTPGGDFTRMMRTIAELGRSGKAKKLGEPRTMIHIAAVISRYGSHVQSVSPPHFVLRAMGALARFV